MANLVEMSGGEGNSIRIGNSSASLTLYCRCAACGEQASAPYESGTKIKMDACPKCGSKSIDVSLGAGVPAWWKDRT